MHQLKYRLQKPKDFIYGDCEVRRRNGSLFHRENTRQLREGSDHVCLFHHCIPNSWALGQGVEFLRVLRARVISSDHHARLQHPINKPWLFDPVLLGFTLPLSAQQIRPSPNAGPGLGNQPLFGLLLVPGKSGPNPYLIQNWRSAATVNIQSREKQLLKKIFFHLLEF